MVWRKGSTGKKGVRKREKKERRVGKERANEGKRGRRKGRG